MTENRCEPGHKAPVFTLPDQNGTPVSSTDFLGSRLIVFFYPAAMTPGCTGEACDFRDSLGTLKAAGYAVIGISKDSPATNNKFRQKEGLTFPLLSDEDLSVHRAYGAFGTKNMYGKIVEGVLRSTFVIDPQGVLELALYNVRAKGHVASLQKKLGITG